MHTYLDIKSNLVNVKSSGIEFYFEFSVVQTIGIFQIYRKNLTPPKKYFQFFPIKHVFRVCVYLLDFFCSGIQFNLLLSPYPCFISLLYLDLYVLGDDALIS